MYSTQFLQFIKSWPFIWKRSAWTAQISHSYPQSCVPPWYIFLLLFTFYRSRRLPSSVTVYRRGTILIFRSRLCRRRNTGNTSIGTYICNNHRFSIMLIILYIFTNACRSVRVMFLDHFCWIINVSFIKRLSELMCVELKMFNILFGF